VEWNWKGKIEVFGEKPVPVPICPPQIPHGLTRDRIRASAVVGRRLTAWAMARPFEKCFLVPIENIMLHALHSPTGPLRKESNFLPAPGIEPRFLSKLPKIVHWNIPRATTSYSYVLAIYDLSDLVTQLKFCMYLPPLPIMRQKHWPCLPLLYHSHKVTDTSKAHSCVCNVFIYFSAFMIQLQHRPLNMDCKYFFSLTMGDNYYIRHRLKFLWYPLTKHMKSMIHVSRLQVCFFIMKRMNLGG
jgi:hypothetical protein